MTEALDTPILRAYPPLSRNRNFLLLWAGYVVSALGDRIHFMVMLKLLVDLKHIDKGGTAETAQLNVMMLLPYVLLGPITGVLADRLPRRLVMITSDLVRLVIVVVARTIFLAVPVALQATLHWPNISYAVALLLLSELAVGVFTAFFSPARTALMPNLVHPDQLLRANSMTNGAGTIASLLGFMAGGKLVEWWLPGAMYVDAAMYLASACSLMAMRTPKRVGVARPREREALLRDFLTGLRYVWRHKRTLQVIGLMFLFWCAGAVILSGLTGVVTHKFGKSEEWYAYFMGLVGIGMLVGAVVMSLARRGVAKEVGIAWSMVMVGVFLFAFSVPQGWGPALGLLMAAAFFAAILMISLDTLLQRIVPDFVRGRVMAARDVASNVALVGLQVPLALVPNIDNYIVMLLRILAVMVVAMGSFLVWFYYRRSALPVMVAIVRRFCSAYLSVWHRFERGNACRIPPAGPVIFVANHTSALDPLVLQAASRRRLIHFMMAKEYYEKWPFRYLYKWLGVIPVNRTGNDTASIRAALRALKDGEVIGMFPEGRISEDGRLQEGRAGVALLALQSGATVVPAYIQGTRVHAGMVNDFVKNARITAFFGSPLRFDDLAGKGRDAEAREAATGRIMGAIRALRERHETDPFRRTESGESAGEKPGGTVAEQAAKI
ncbi:MAG TPA: MFS transporter [Phycisphaerae bacterium]|nr:MFS transporter [Phycisphaerae bacterium]